MLEKVIGQSWVPILEKEFNSEYLQKLAKWISYSRQSNTVYPDSEDVFKALQLCPYGQVKVVILGKEPYPNGEADGLAFSYKGGMPKGQGKQSLDVILDEIENDCYEGFNPGRDYQLDYLAKQGVLLLNSRLTVFRNQVDSHKEIGWEKLTRVIVNSLIEEYSPKVFMLWGGDAQALMYQSDKVRTHTDKLNGHLILNTYHPAYDLHKRDQFGNIIVKHPNGFTGCKHFSQANKFLLENQLSAIDWFPVEEPYFNIKLSDQPPF